MNINEILSVIEKELQQPLWDNWYLKEKIGSGSFSGVYRIEAQRMRRTDVSALKIEPITAESSLFYDDARRQSWFQHKKSLVENESTIMYRLRDCPYIVTYEDEDIRELVINGRQEGWYFLIRMEYLACIENLIRSKKMALSEQEVLKLAKDIGRGIKAAHDINVIHRDIKPANFFRAENGTYKLGDFNVSKQTDTTRTFAGTLGYLAPEIYRVKTMLDNSYTGQADIYSFGISLYQLMNNMYLPLEERCFSDEAVTLRMEGARFANPKNASAGFSRIIMKACAFRPEDRYQTMEEMLQELENLKPAADADASDAFFVYFGEDDGRDAADSVRTAAEAAVQNTPVQPAAVPPELSRSEVCEEPAIPADTKPERKAAGRKLLPIVSVVLLTVTAAGAALFLAADRTPESARRSSERRADAQTSAEETASGTASENDAAETTVSNSPAAPSAYIYWDENDMFFIDYSLLGMSYDAVCEVLGIQLSPPVYSFDAENTYWASYNGFAKPAVTFTFENDRCITIYNEQKVPCSDALREDIVAHYGEHFNEKDIVYIQDADCYYMIFAKEYEAENGETVSGHVQVYSNS